MIYQGQFQYVLALSNGSDPSLPLIQFSTAFGGDYFWDSTNARIKPAILPYIAAIPLFVTGLITSYLALQWFLPRPPMWARNFVQETKPSREGLGPQRKTQSPFWVICLLLVSIAGLILESVNLSLNWIDIKVLMSFLSWICAILLVASIRPRCMSYPLLILVLSMLVSHVIVLANQETLLVWKNLPSALEVLISSSGIIMFLLMPFRSPLLDTEGISPSSGPATKNLRSPEDNLRLWQYLTVSWMGSLISAGSKRQLQDEDVWSLAYEFKHERLFEAFKLLKGSILKRLIDANGIDLILGVITDIVNTLASLVQPLLLQQLLASAGNSESSKRAPIIFSILLFLAGCVQTQVNVIGLWVKRRCYERSRGEMITVLFEKTLKRRMAITPLENDEDSPANTSLNEADDSSKRSATLLNKFYSKITASIPKSWRDFSFSTRKYTVLQEAKRPASLGKILNILKSDIYEVAQIFWDAGDFVVIPTKMILSIILIWKLLGLACMLGALTVIAAQVLTAMIARAIIRWEKIRRLATDMKLQVVSQFIESIRHLRWYGWQHAWLNDILDKRQQELNLRVVNSLWNMLITIVNGFASGLFPFISFYVYTVVLDRPLRVDLAFPALQLFNTLETSLRRVPGLITMLINASVALGRIEGFMKESDKIENKDETALQGEMELINASYAWPGSSTTVLKNISIKFIPGFNVVGGKVAAGKSALLLALLGELDMLGGTYKRSNDAVGYCAQSPWLQSLSIRDNILFHSPYDESRYKDVLEACALTPDLVNFKHGDLTIIGENGVGLSGGQRARVALARAIYSNAHILMLDDPLSALDHQTASWIVHKCFKGSLVEGRTVVLVTHRLDLCRNVADCVILVEGGSAHIVNTISELSTDAKTNEFQSTKDYSSADDNGIPQAADATPEKFLEDEHREHGGVKLSVYWEYVKAGKLKWWTVFLVFLAIYRLIYVAQSWFLKEWGEAYDRPVETVLSTPISRFFDRLPSPQENVKPWLAGFFFITIARAVSESIVDAFMRIIIYVAGKQMFKNAILKVANATFRFYDVTPIGRLMNRMTSDISTIDGDISRQFRAFVELSVIWASSLIVIAAVNPIFSLFSFGLTATIVWVFRKFLPTSQSLRRLEMASLSPLMSDFGALVDGVVTIRAFCAQSQFQDRIINTTDSFQKMDHFYWSLQSWLAYRFDFFGDFGMFLLVQLALNLKLPAGLIAFTLVSGLQFVQASHLLCVRYGQLQMSFVSVERVVELLNLDQEAPGSLEPPASWPTYSGDLVFDNVTIRYAPHLEPALKELSFTIRGGSTTAIVGRTGSGKSTLALTLLATIMPECGSVTIDGIDVSYVNKQALRSRITFLAQDPALFPGTLRSNLDPLLEHSDHDCEHVIERVCPDYAWTLSKQIDAGGKNLSQGQRQLIGLARAILRKSSIIILDEATASVDLETSRKVQKVLREELSAATVVTIAHRVEAVRGADRYLVFGKGKLVEEGTVSQDGGLVPVSRDAN